MAAKKTAAPKKSPAKKPSKQVWFGFDPDMVNIILSTPMGDIFFSSKKAVEDAYLEALELNDWVGKIAFAKIDSVVKVVKMNPTLEELDMNVEFQGVV